MERLNRFALEPGADINALSSQHGIKSDGSRIVEAYRRIDQINLYSPDGKLCKTITAAKKLQSPHSVSPRGDRMLYYRDIKTTDDYFAVLYLKDKESRIEKGKNKAPTIQFFYWNGKPMAELTLNKPVSTFEIDEKGGLLYTLDDTTEQMYMYDISGFINILNQIKKASK